MNQPKISVILPNYNYAKYLPIRLKEILAQTYRISEIIILDDASTDNSIAVIKKELHALKTTHPEIKTKTIFNKKNSGSVFSQWQKGIAAATCDYIWIAELDDSCSSDFLAIATAPIIEDRRVILSYTGSKLIGDISLKDRLRSTILDRLRRRHLHCNYVVDGKVELKKNLAVFNSIPNVSACVFKKIPDLIEILDEAKTYRLSGDWLFYARLATLGKIAFSSKRANYHRLSQETVTGQISLEKRYQEVLDIHSRISEFTDLSMSTQARMSHLERRLKTNWHL
ncbi:glycosyltransferase family 2 protein [Candidatus Saccharibacteria bacterium]|nr:glycosyltransferase family 2 protein [Candidatus Saccharibacteria bacterium]